ncbi:MAG: c-type cytochrome biogenesis protein CcmI [Xanthobacteraceae bacterium]|nr:c-type cytochrome biogenesis protein CcmI [Xanthobacteraceae bacterium]
MSLWFVLALMTFGAIFAVLWPLGRRAARQPEGRESAVYRDQLAEVDRDIAAGLIGETEAAAARVEIGRRLIAAADAEEAAAPPSSLRLRRAVAVVALVGVPVLAGGLYLRLGTPAMPDFPLASRMRAPAGGQSLDQLVAQVQAHLEKNPTDGRGWGVLAPVLGRVGRFEDAAQAFRNAIRYDGDSATRRAGLGEALAGAANGVVTAEAKAEFERAVALDASDVRARYFLGLAAEQDGRPKEAAAIWRAMLDKAPPDAPWRPLVAAALARIGAVAQAAPDGASAKLPALPEGAAAAAQGMSEGDRAAMIRGMVDRLATRLKQNGDDVEGWLRLARAYMVLNEPERAHAARDDARRALAADEVGLRKLNEGLKALGIDG